MTTLGQELPPPADRYLICDPSGYWSPLKPDDARELLKFMEPSNGAPHAMEGYRFIRIEAGANSLAL